MRMVLDACVLYPTVMREVLLGAASKGLFTPLWSVRIIGEWQRAAVRNGDDIGASAGVEIALLGANWPDASVTIDKFVGDEIWLPDPDDVHVLQAAIAGQADAIITANIKDFPTRVLSNHGILRRDPDGFLLELAQNHPTEMDGVVGDVLARAIAISGEDQDLRKLLKRTRLPRLAKYMAARIN
ncbi:PIN domain-containing protein [Amylibacter ulvae]|uniref:PIN domain-containing protein n=1 Tax=Paramylibacter ulvae TaxID=1651968 RepID=A0ABQ3D2E5_9RHOB|nr:PIN domain-containing protein [Amylibacter ulvae]GHA53201.1 PIN domain-containing protein [Amylibacter ulvae]